MANPEEACMEYVTVHGADIPKLGFGTFRLQDTAAADATAAALAAGYRHIDTAQVYENEREVGQALADSGVPRDEIFLTTKVWVDRFRDGDLQASVRESLERLGVDHVDLLLLHWPNPEVPLEETVAALNEVRGDGLTRHIGVSNFTVELLDRAVAASDAPLVTDQVEYHPQLSQAPVLEALRRHGMALTAYCPLGQGRAVDEPVVKEIAANHGKDPGQVILRWHYQQPGVIAIPRSSKPGRIRSNLEILDFALSDDEMRQLSELARPDGRIVDPESLAPKWDTAG
jgi:diketogulonate reductase-like aldo/keto reductase